MLFLVPLVPAEYRQNYHEKQSVREEVQLRG